MNDYILFILCSFLLLDLLIPYILAVFYKGYSHKKQVMSVLGCKNAPLHKIYNIWLVLLGVIIIISSIYIFLSLHNTSGIILFLFIVLLLYALGGCIIAGLFAVEETKELVTLQAKIHGISAAAGFLLLTFAPLLTGIYFIKISCILPGILSLLCFLLTVLFFMLFIMADKPKFKNTIINSEGLWQRLSLLFMYIPVIMLCGYVII